MKPHYYATCAFGYNRAETREEALQGLADAYIDSTMVRNTQKNGEPGFYMWSCKVEAEIGDYSIEWFQPKGVPISEAEENFCTYITKKKASAKFYTPNPFNAEQE